MTGFEKFIRNVPRRLFQLRVGIHGTVALGTHAPAVAFDPRFWNTYVRNFGKMYHMVASRSFYEAQMQDLVRRENYGRQVRSGLVVDPFKHEDFIRPGVTSEMAEKISRAMSQSLGIDTKWFTKMGDRGYSVLKVLRSDMFDQHWNNLPKQMQTDEVATAIADAVNHITGVVNVQAPLLSEYVLFAPKLQMSRAAFLAGDPFRALNTARRMAVGAGMRAVGYERKIPKVTPAEKWFAVNELKTKIYAGGTFLSLLALNQGILSSSGSKQKINLTDPLKSDFAKFKVAGLNLSYGNPLITMARLPLRIGALAEAAAGKGRRVVYPDENAGKMVWDYFRSQFAPAASLLADVVLREDWQERQLGFPIGPIPASQQPEPKRLRAQGVEPYTPAEYWLEQASPIPLQEFWRQTWETGFGLSPEQLKTAVKALGSTLFMGGTGARISEDREIGQ
jgi:hypothetical protein